MAKSIKKYWTAAATRFCQEQRAAHHVERQGFEFYLPEILSLTSKGTDRRELLFPGYIFIRVRAGWESLMGTRGISRLFLCSDKPTRIPDNEIEYFKSLETDVGTVQLDPPLIPGMRVFGNEHAGSFCGVSGVVRGMPSRNRVRVLLELLGRSIEVDMDRRVLSTA